MSNTLKASVEFSFRGEDYHYAATFDLDALLARHEQFPNFAALLAQVHHVDTYSYLYEVMEDADVVLSEAQGVVATFAQNGELDTAGLVGAWSELRVFVPLQHIALSTLGIADLNAHPELNSALRQAYQLGVQQ